MTRFILFLILLLGNVCAQQDYFFKDFRANNLPQELNLAFKRTQEVHPCAHLNAQAHYTSTGTREPDACTKSFKKSATLAYDLALGFFVSGDQTYGHKAQEILNAWAQQLKSADTLQSQDNINFYLPYMNMAYGFLKKMGPSPVYEDFVKRMLSYSQSNMDTNHGAWGILLDVSTALVLEDHALLDRSAQRWQEWILNAINRHGVIENAISRSNTNNYHGGPKKGIKGIAYSHFALLAITIAGELLFENGHDLWHSLAGNRLELAYQQIANWVLNPESFVYFQPGLVGVHNDAYFVILAKYYHSSSAEILLKQGDLRADGFRLKLRAP
ncbi:alginate lyase family protein [Helicobacter vulpis]|uniref:alginate lyase family protein n=1 Tax=Helicobacter vulpis TaxID=2316076 RepID=UPI000EB267B4|nr:alginate lyase family protein [Helicobacter vulpis]